MEELQARHRKELRELQNKITQKKKNATKKTRKGVNDECDVLQRDMQERHQAETAVFEGTNVAEAVQNLNLSQDSVESQEAPQTNESASEKVQSSVLSRDDGDVATSESSQHAKKPNRQKARLARRAAEQEAQSNAAAEEAANLPDLRDQEMKAMKSRLEQLGLEETFIRPDGHCLYSACAHGLPAEKVKTSGPFSTGYQNVRHTTAAFMSSHPDDFAAFLEEPLDTYVNKVRNTAEWGGQLELQAIARSYNIDINVVQASGRTEKILAGEQEKTEDGDRLWLAYYRHSFGLGEHYNALHKAGKP